MRHYSLAIHYSLFAGLCCDMVHGHSHDLLDFPSVTMMAWKRYVAIPKWIDYRLL